MKLGCRFKDYKRRAALRIYFYLLNLQLAGPGEVHLPLGPELAGRAEVRADSEPAGAAAAGGPEPAGALPHARHDDTLPRLQREDQGGSQLQLEMNLCKV